MRLQEHRRSYRPCHVSRYHVMGSAQFCRREVFAAWSTAGGWRRGPSRASVSRVSRVCVRQSRRAYVHYVAELTHVYIPPLSVVEVQRAGGCGTLLLAPQGGKPRGRQFARAAVVAVAEVGPEKVQTQPGVRQPP